MNKRPSEIASEQLRNSTLAKESKNIQEGLILANRLLVDYYGTIYQYNWYQRLLLLSNYFTSLYRTVTDVKSFLLIENDFFYQLWFNGELVVTYAQLADKFYLWRVSQKYYDGVVLKKVDCHIIQYGLNHKDYYQKGKSMTFFVGVNCVYLKWNKHVFPAIFWYREFIDQLLVLEKVFINNTVWDSKRFLKMVNNTNENISQEEDLSFSDPTYPFIKIINPTSGFNNSNNVDSKSLLSNLFKPVDFGSSNSSQAFENLNNYLNYMFNWFGVLVPIEQKKERKTFTESKTDIYNTKNIEEITLKELNNFSATIKKLYHLEINFERTTQLEMEDATTDGGEGGRLANDNQPQNV